MTDDKTPAESVNLSTLSDLCTPWCIHVVATLRIADHIAAGKVEIGDIAAAARCQRNGGWTTTVSAPSRSAISTDRASFTNGSVDHTLAVTSRQGE